MQYSSRSSSPNVQLSPRTTALCYLIFKRIERLNNLLLPGAALLISTLGASIDSLSESIYEVFPRFPFSLGGPSAPQRSLRGADAPRVSLRRVEPQIGPFRTDSAASRALRTALRLLQAVQNRSPSRAQRSRDRSRLRHAAVLRAERRRADRGHHRA